MAPKNTALSEEEVAKINKDFKKKYPKSKYKAVLREDGMMNWETEHAIDNLEVNQVMKFSGSIGRTLCVNTGGHGGKNGSNPSDYINGDPKVVNEDLLAAHQIDGNFVVHIMSEGVEAIEPPGIDGLFTWCHSSKNRKKVPTICILGKTGIGKSTFLNCLIGGPTYAWSRRDESKFPEYFKSGNNAESVTGKTEGIVKTSFFAQNKE